MDRQQECTIETLRRIKRDLNLPQSFIDDALNYWDGWDFSSRRIHIHVYSMIAVMRDKGIPCEEAMEKVKEFLGGFE